MVSIKNLQWELKVAVIFALIALIVSPVIGLISGNNFTVIIVRAVIFTIVFAVIGYGSILVIKKFIPEFYSAFFSVSPVSESDVNSNSTKTEENAGESYGSYESQVSEETQDDAEAYPEHDASGTTDSGSGKYADEALNNVSGNKMGKHILEEKGMQFEPKLMAEAIRTMMNKDE